MQLSEIVDLQRDFDQRHVGRFEWAKPTSKDPDAVLQFLLVALLGELGEMANLVKKIARGDCSLEEVREQIRSELADVFIYVLKMAHQTNIDLEGAFLDKLKVNERRFRSFERETSPGTDAIDISEVSLPVALESLHEAKYLAAPDREKLLRALLALFPIDSGMIEELHTVLGEDIGCWGDESLALSALIAIVLADAVGTENPLAREDWIVDIQVFCATVGVSFGLVEQLASRASQVEAILSRYLVPGGKVRK